MIMNVIVGLHGRFFDASAGWANIIERKGVYDFNGAFANTYNIYLYKKAGATVSLTSSSKVGKFTPDDLHVHSGIKG